MVGQILPMRRRPQFIISTGRQASHSLSGFQTQNVTGQGGAVGIQTHHMKQKSELPLILGGHSFIAQLGSDPLASEEEQLKIVEGCLEHGIRWFDTTYRPERVALGRVLAALGRRDDATVLAWNFFTDFLPGESVGDAACYRPESIEIILEELGTTYVDCLVMVPAKDPEENQRQKELLIDWQTKGYVRALGLWISDLRQIEEQQGWDSFRFAIRPFNVATKKAAPIFASCKRQGWEMLATSPFVRGWELERLVAKALSRGLGDVENLKQMLADLMLRFSLFQPDVDRVIVAMRKAQWVSCNAASVAKGPLTSEELCRLEDLRGPRAKKRSFWQRLHRWL